MRYDNGFQILYDPSQTYERDRLFGRRDFKQSLKEGVWPQHLMVRDLKTKQCYQVSAMDLEEMEDRDWFEYRKEQLDGWEKE